MKRKNVFLFTPWFMGVLFIVFAMSMAFATFYENDFGPVAARSLVYDTHWFELIMLLMVVNLIGQIFQFKLYKRNKLSILLFHLAFVFIIIGAGITRYFGFEGVVHIREGETQKTCLTTDKYLKFDIKDQNGKVLFSDSKKFVLSTVKRQKYNKNIQVDGIDYRLKFEGFIPNASESVVENDGGKPMVSLLVSNGMMQRESKILSEGETANIGGISFGFGSDSSVDVRLKLDKDTFKIQSPYSISEMSMIKQESAVHKKNEIIPFETKKIYTINGFSVVAEVLSKSGILKAFSVDNKIQQTNKSAMAFNLKFGNKQTELYLWTGQGLNNNLVFKNENQTLEISFNPLVVELPFKLKLDDFILDRYPGSSSPSSYKSNVVLIDEKDGVNMPYSIYMNHILKYKGWRFYQSSYDRDERGTILSVNRDFAGMFVTYFGYFMLFLFIILSLMNKKSSFRTATANFFKSTAGKTATLILLLLSLSFAGSAQNMSANRQDQKFVIDKSHADDFGKILVQDQGGRTEPLYTLSSDILRKITRKTEFKGYSAMQVFLGLYFDFQNWKNVPLIKVSNSEIKRILSIHGDYAAFSDIVDFNVNNYKLKKYVDAAYSKPAGARDKFDKEIIKVDERLNICYMIYNGEFMKIFPVKDHSMKWHSPEDAYKPVISKEDSLYLRNAVNLYAQGIQSGASSGNYSQADEVLKSIINYQRTFAQYELPSVKKVNAEIFYYKSKIYDRLFPFYATVGFLLLFILLYGIISQRKNLKLIINIFTGILLIGFIFHTIGLGLRWYISGHAPMSNGFESMIFISWVTILAGFIFSKRSAFVLAATSVLGGFTLMVAHLSFMDPEITNLVPVLQSYWLTLHVSVITGSYGFLGLGAIIGLIVLILYSVINQKNKDQILTTIEELTVINYKTLTIGLYLLTIGTFLGAVWANESWGRYWGWDPKETWSLISIIVYSFVTHSRMINGLKGFFSFNLLALFGFSTVLMTYFGVNYYLSGLHSYAAGDPIPVPKFVYVSIVIIVSLSILAYRKYKKPDKK